MSDPLLPGANRVPRAHRASILVYALNRWQTITVVLFAFAGIAGTVAFLDSSPLLIVVWVVFGLVSVGAIVLVSFRDAESVDEALNSRVDADEIKDKILRDKVARAEAYQQAIRETLREVRSPELRASLDLITREMADPVELIFTLAKRLEEYQQDALIQQDRRRLTANRQSLQPAEREQLASLEKLHRLMLDTSSAIDSALARLGSSYSAIQLARSAGELKGSAATQALEDLRQQSQQLHDLNASLDEIYGERTRGGVI